MPKLTFVDSYEIRLISDALDKELDSLKRELPRTPRDFRYDIENDINLVEHILERIQSHELGETGKGSSKANPFNRV